VNAARRSTLYADWLCVGEPGNSRMDDSGTADQLLQGVLSYLGRCFLRPLAQAISTASRPGAQKPFPWHEDESNFGIFPRLSTPLISSRRALQRPRCFGQRRVCPWRTRTIRTGKVDCVCVLARY